MRQLLLGAAVAAFIAIPGVASADWGWTRWTMGVDQVVAGSGGKLTKMRGREGQRVHGWELMATGPLTYEGFKFNAEFFFDMDGKALKVVRLTLVDPSQCDALDSRMRAKHGAPVDASKDFGMLKMRSLSWAEIEGGDFLGLTGLSAVGDQPPLCFIRFRPPGYTNGG
jgi:hypothetical protein